MAATRRLITGHDDNGKAIFASDTTLKPHDPFRSDGAAPPPGVPGFITIHRTNGIPAKVNEPYTEIHPNQIPLYAASGVTCRIVDFPPVSGNEEDRAKIMHRTQSLDYGVVLEGTIRLLLDDGVEKTLNQGDICVQMATMHGWLNTSNANARMMFVLVPSDEPKVKETGEVLEPKSVGHLSQSPDEPRL